MHQKGFTLIEIVIVIIIIGIIATVAVRTMKESITTSYYEQTKQEMDQLVMAMVGNQDVTTSGSRGQFGYVGDVGSLPPDLDALVSNPGGYSTWDGPYINAGFSANEFKTDAWGTLYTFNDTLLRSTGSGANIDKIIANTTSGLTSNNIRGSIIDASHDSPGSTYKDSLEIQITYPNGVGSTTTTIVSPSASGWFTIGSLPIGQHSLKIIYIPDTDTVSHLVTIYPGDDIALDIVFPADLW